MRLGEWSDACGVLRCACHWSRYYIKISGLGSTIGWWTRYGIRLVE